MASDETAVNTATLPSKNNEESKSTNDDATDEKVDLLQIETETLAAFEDFLNKLQSKDPKYKDKDLIKKEFGPKFMGYLKNKQYAQFIAKQFAEPQNNKFSDFLLNEWWPIDHELHAKSMMNYIYDTIINKNNKDIKYKLLEIGSGNGDLINLILNSKYNNQIDNILIIEISENAIKTLKNRFKNEIKNNKIKILKCDIKDLNLNLNNIKLNSFDIIFTMHCFYFWSDINKCGKILNKLLKQNGNGYIISGHTWNMIFMPKNIFKNEKKELFLEMLKNNQFNINSIKCIIPDKIQPPFELMYVENV